MNFIIQSRKNLINMMLHTAFIGRTLVFLFAEQTTHDQSSFSQTHKLGNNGIIMALYSQIFTISFFIYTVCS